VVRVADRSHGSAPITRGGLSMKLQQRLPGRLAHPIGAFIDGEDSMSSR
jgi:hypothetical protein